MPPRLYLFSAGRALTSVSTRGTTRPDFTSFIPTISRRTVTADEKPLPTTDKPKGLNQNQLPHVSEEAAATCKITGDGGPEIEQGTPVQEVRHSPFSSWKVPYPTNHLSTDLETRCRWPEEGTSGGKNGIELRYSKGLEIFLNNCPSRGRRPD